MARAKNGEGSCKLMKDNYWHFNKQLDILDENGRNIRIHTTGKTEEEARAKGLEKEKQRRKTQKFDVEGKWTGKETLGSLIEEFCLFKLQGAVLRDRWTASTYEANIDMYNSTIKKHSISKLQVHMLNVRIFKEYYQSLDEVEIETNGKAKVGYEYSYKRRIRLLLIQVLNYLLKNAYPGLEDNYAFIAEINKPHQDAVPDDYSFAEEEEEILRDEDIPKFLEAMVENRYKAAAALVLMLSTGIRSEELFALQLNKDYKIDEDGKSGVLFIYKAVGTRYKDPKDHSKGKERYLKRTKNGDHRLALLDEISIEAIRRMEANAKYFCKDNPHNLLYPTIEGDYYDRDTFAGSFKRLCNAKEIYREPGWGPHICRATFISFNTLRYDQMKNPLLLMKTVGHRDPSMTFNVYSRMNGDTLKNSNIKSPFAILRDLEAQYEEEHLEDE